MRLKRDTVAWWIRRFGYTISLWHVYTNKYGTMSLTVGCYDVRDPQSAHQFFF
jgi:hypothetical protein